MKNIEKVHPPMYYNTELNILIVLKNLIVLDNIL